ncbi:hypothetical protein LTR56_006655 [Elasticomyces elasticus]|nr:hypothetical protein LTR22_012820 [Elasticomyces elasticus]KAK3649756.1 hypothetical protein LTR56_006655 [Elasticomyces elasticus]KAK4918091.1 hypothetical protein LTR49_014095 [Elasticomyces elasticus]KAK5757410.1 hypothetical protein LTS12_012493 [Elasticomyces elasticus]
MATEGGSQVVPMPNTQHKAACEDSTTLVKDPGTLAMDSTSSVDLATLAEDSSESVKRAIHKTSADTKGAPAEDDSLWRKLPGEIRNAVYELLYVPSLLDPSDGICIRYGRWRSKEDPLAHYHRWEEPGLLMAAKWIRLEAQQIYYQTSIHIAVSTGEIARTCEWMRTIAATINKDGKQSLGSVTLWLTECEWNDMDTWVALASLVRDHEFGAELKIHKGEPGWYPCREGPTSEDRDIDQRHRRMAAALQEVVASGIRARSHAWSSDELETAFSYLVEAMLIMRMTTAAFLRRTPRDLHRQTAIYRWSKALPRMEKGERPTKNTAYEAAFLERVRQIALYPKI